MLNKFLLDYHSFVCKPIAIFISYLPIILGHPMVDVCVLLAPFYLPGCFGLIDGMKDMDLSLNGLPSIQEVTEFDFSPVRCACLYL